ncbi:MAG TPA: hypothetical protein VN737_01325 [Bryobacteraceae bacterium]|nr:hypothetical protein [Bryobacteraceae bacterium]
MDKQHLQQCEDAPETSSMNGYAPKKYSAREHAVLSLKIFLGTGGLLGFLWVVNLLKVH